LAPDGQPAVEAVSVFGLDIAPLTLDETLERLQSLVEAATPSYVVTANLNYAMLSSRDPRLAAINDEAAFILADGMPLVWAARLARTPLPERTTGADLVPRLAVLAAERGYRMFLVGGVPQATQAAATILRQRCAELNHELDIVGIECPMVDALSREETQALVSRIQAAKPDIVLVALGQPKGELWMARHYRSFGTAVSLQIGAGLDFVAGRVRRAPRWMQRGGLEWLYRLYEEPKRLWRRYSENALFLTRVAAQSAARSIEPRWGSRRRLETESLY
jgi:N-acetylglucosaminyldiphosphoundecaprenol N-acetyl-beta-D-mannosaminyltransferase